MTSFEKKRILVTGGAGFLGSHLCERLVAGGNEVICLDNYYTGSKNNISSSFPITILIACADLAELL